jgi:hypothetical protein
MLNQDNLLGPPPPLPPSEVPASVVRPRSAGIYSGACRSPGAENVPGLGGGVRPLTVLDGGASSARIGPVLAGGIGPAASAVGGASFGYNGLGAVAPASVVAGGPVYPTPHARS